MDRIKHDATHSSNHEHTLMLCMVRRGCAVVNFLWKSDTSGLVFSRLPGLEASSPPLWIINQPHIWHT